MGKRWFDPPIILEKRPEDATSAAGDGAIERLVMNGQACDANQKIGLGIAGNAGAAQAGKIAAVADDPEAVLKGLNADVHLITAKVDSHREVVLMTDKL